MDYAHARMGGTTLTIRTSADPMSVAPSLRTLLSSVDRTQPLFDVKPLDVVLADSIAPRRLTLLLLGTFAAVGAAARDRRHLRRRRRMPSRSERRRSASASRSAPRAVKSWRWSCGQGMAITLGGIALGLGAAIASTHVMTALLYEVTPTDLATFAAAAVDRSRHGLRGVLRPGNQGIPRRSARRTSVRVSVGLASVTGDCARLRRRRQCVATRRSHAEARGHRHEPGSESAFILRITWPRCAFTVISLMPSSPPTCLFSSPDTTSAITSRSRRVSDA